MPIENNGELPGMDMIDLSGAWISGNNFYNEQHAWDLGQVQDPIWPWLADSTLDAAATRLSTAYGFNSWGEYINGLTYTYNVGMLSASDRDRLFNLGRDLANAAPGSWQQAYAAWAFGVFVENRGLRNEPDWVNIPYVTWPPAVPNITGP